MKIQAVIDRIEGEFAVLELAGKGEVIWPLNLLPKGIQPGNILDFGIELNLEAEKEQREKIQNMQNELRDKN